jgi:hypothetical protein
MGSFNESITLRAGEEIVSAAAVDESAVAELRMFGSISGINGISGRSGGGSGALSGASLGSKLDGSFSEHDSTEASESAAAVGGSEEATLADLARLYEATELAFVTSDALHNSLKRCIKMKYRPARFESLRGLTCHILMFIVRK